MGELADPVTGQTTAFDITWCKQVVDALSIDTVMYTDSSISGYIFNYLYGDGLWDAGEPDIPGCGIKLFDVLGAFIAKVSNGVAVAL